MVEEDNLTFYTDEYGRSFVNITSLDHFAPIEVSGISIGIGFGFLASFIALFVALISLVNQITKVKKIELPRNAKILFILISIFMAIQMVNIVVRIVSDFLTIYLRMKMEEKVKITKALYVAYSFMSTATGFVMLLNFVTLFVVISYVQTIFLNTSYQVRALSANLTDNLKKGLYTISGIFAFSMFIIVSIVAVFHFLHLLGLLGQTAITVSTTIGFLVGSGMLTFNAAFTLWSGIVVIRAIKKNTYRLSMAHVEKSQQKGFVKRQANPFLVTILLISGMVLCVLLQIVAAGVATVVGGSESSGVKIVWQVSTSFAVLVCSSLSMSMFYPMFVHAEKAIKEMTFYHNKSSAITSAQETANTNIITSSANNEFSVSEQEAGDNIVCVSPTSPFANGDMSSPSTTNIPLVAIYQQQQQIDQDI